MQCNSALTISTPYQQQYNSQRTRIIFSSTTHPLLLSLRLSVTSLQHNQHLTKSQSSPTQPSNKSTAITHTSPPMDSPASSTTDLSVDAFLESQGISSSVTRRNKAQAQAQSTVHQQAQNHPLALLQSTMTTSINMFYPLPLTTSTRRTSRTTVERVTIRRQQSMKLTE